MKFISSLLLLILFSCSTNMKIETFKNNQPKLVLEKYFEGKTKAWGMFHDRFGNLKRSFKVDINGVLQDNILTLDEKFLYDDGEKETRVWKIKILGNNMYSGIADDVIGEAKGIS